MAQLKYLLDTNILSDLIKQPDGNAARKIAALEDEDMYCTSIIVACELRYGAQKKASPTLTAKVNQLLEAIAVLPLKQNIEPHYAMLRVALERAGNPYRLQRFTHCLPSIGLGPYSRYRQCKRIFSYS